MSKLRWHVRQLIPTAYRTRYRTEDGAQHFCVWWMWLGHSFAIDDVVVAR